MVHDVRIGDRADNAATVAELAGQLSLEKNDVRASVSVALGVHAVVSGDTDDGTQLEQPPDLGVNRAVKLARLGGLRRELVLHVVGQREVEKIGATGGEQFHADTQGVQAGFAGVDGGLRPGERLNVIDAVDLQAHVVGLLGGDGDAVHALGEQFSQFVLGRDHRDPAAGGRGGCEDGVVAQEAGGVGHHLLAGVGVEDVVAADAGLRRRRAGDHGAVVDVGERRQRTAGLAVVAAGGQLGQVGQFAVREAKREVFPGAAVDADDHHRPIRQAVVALIDSYCFQNNLLTTDRSPPTSGSSRLNSSCGFNTRRSGETPIGMSRSLCYLFRPVYQ